MANNGKNNQYMIEHRLVRLRKQNTFSKTYAIACLTYKRNVYVFF